MSSSDGSQASQDSLDELVVRFVQPRDAGAVRALFRKIFNEEMSQRHWEWKYQRPQSRAVVVYKGDNLLAHYGGVGTDIILEGEKRAAIQIADLMVDPDVRNAVRSRSPFYLSGKMFLESTVGYDNDFLLAYGFPSERAMGLSERLGFFAPVGRMMEVRWDANKSKQSWLDKIVPVTKENFDKYAADMDSLWKSFQGLFKDRIICRKDSDFVRWRYLEHPSKSYNLHLIKNRISGKPSALLVLKCENGSVMLMDFLTRSLNLAKVVEKAKYIAYESEKSQLTSWCSDTFIDIFKTVNSRVKELPIIIPACTATPGPPTETQKMKWWFMPGDTDYL